MRNKKIITIVLAAMLACTAVTACGKKEATDEFEKTVEVETDVVAETEEPETVESEVAAEPEVVDTTYCKLMSDPNFDMENAVRDDWQSDYVRDNVHSAQNSHDVLFNYVDGDRYAEITGATVTEINKTITMDRSDAKFAPHLAYYGVEPNPSIADALRMFALIDTTINDVDTPISETNEVTVINAYTIPEDTNNSNGWLVLVEADEHSDYEEFLCEVEYKGKQGYAILNAKDLGLIQ